VNSRKLQRWTDLLVALLRHGLGATFTELSRDVPGYELGDQPSERDKATVKRMFERDKAELIAFGVPIETVEHGDEIEKYRLRSSNFYLPYLSVAGGAKRPNRVDKDGYHSVQQLAFEPDELAAIASAAARAEKLGDPLLAESARSAARKLAFDLPHIGAGSHDEVLVHAERLDRSLVAELDFALLGRKRLSFTYRSFSTDSTTTRTVEPLGIFFLNSHWYVAAREEEGSPVKNFRVSRMRDVKANRASPQTPDFAAPPTFNLRDHTRSRLAWELGDADANEAVVEFESSHGSVVPWLQLGAQVPGHAKRRAFRVRQLERFARWILSFGGAAKAISPPALEESVRRMARETLARYEDAT
jgi:proteasome accessory factor C